MKWKKVKYWIKKDIEKIIKNLINELKIESLKTIATNDVEGKNYLIRNRKFSLLLENLYVTHGIKLKSRDCKNAHLLRNDNVK